MPLRPRCGDTTAARSRQLLLLASGVRSRQESAAEYSDPLAAEGQQGAQPERMKRCEH